MNAISEITHSPTELASEAEELPEAETPAEAPAPRRSILRRLRPALLLAALSGAAVGGAWYWGVGRFMESTDNAYVQGDISVLSPRVDGYVAAIHVADNQAVAAGEALIDLDDRVWRAALDQAE